jgi:hypothetical protein
MMKTKLFAMLMASLVLFYTSCSEKETPQPVEDSERIDALRQELRNLQVLVYGEEVENDYLDADNFSMEEELEALQAEVTALKATYDKSVSYSVLVVDYAGNAIAGAKVTVNQNGKITTVDANAAGLAIFKDVRAGAIIGVVKATGFATANYRTTLNNVDNGGGSTTVPLLPKSGTQAEASMFTLTGFLYANLNNANDTLSGSNFDGAIVSFSGTPVVGPDGSYPHRSFDKQNRKIKATIYLDLGVVPFSIYNSSAAGSIRRMAYEDAVYEGTVDANNKYSIKLPSTAATIQQDFYFDYKFSFEEFSADKIFVAYDENGTSYDGLAPNGEGVYMGDSPNSAFPTPKTFTQKRVFRISDRTYDSYSWGTTAEGALPGSVYALNFFYSEYLN